MNDYDYGNRSSLWNSSEYQQRRLRRMRRRRRRRQIRTIIILVLLWAATMMIVGFARSSFGEKPDKTTISSEKEAEKVTKTDKLSGKDAASAPKKDDWRLVLVNPKNPLPKDHSITTTTLASGQVVDERCYPDLQEMLDDCRAAGLSPLICSSYRTQEKQERLFNNQVEYWLGQGYSQEDAKVEAGKAVAVPGTSEHQLGLAFDIVDENHQLLDESQEKTEVQQWLLENSWKYGFVLRYPNDKSEVTGIIYEPWHYRYVGKEAAKEIYDRGICLEEYLGEA